MAESVKIGKDWGGDIAMLYLNEHPITFSGWLNGNRYR